MRSALQEWLPENKLREANEEGNSALQRRAIKMATGSGKTVVMAMLIAWQALNKLANPQDKRFCDAFLIVAPGITIRDRLRVLLPNDPDNYYREDGRGAALAARTTPQGQDRGDQLPCACSPRSVAAASKLTKAILAGPAEDG